MQIYTNNPSQILVSLADCAEMIVDLTAGEAQPYSVLISDIWDSKTFSQANTLSDFRETKAYAVYISKTCSYQGLQDNDPINPPDSDGINVSFNGPPATEYKDNTTGVNFANFKIKSGNLDVSIENLAITITNGAANNRPLQNFKMVDEYKWANLYADCSTSLYFRSLN